MQGNVQSEAAILHEGYSSKNEGMVSDHFCKENVCLFDPESPVKPDKGKKVILTRSSSRVSSKPTRFL